MGSLLSTKRASDELLDKEIAILKVSSNLTEEEIRDIYDDFKRQCPSGRMDKNQFLKCSKAFMESEDEKTDVPHVMFSVFDKNRDGTIDFSEFVLIIAMGNKEDLDSRLELVFEILDTSNDGRISYDEMMDFLEITVKRLFYHIENNVRFQFHRGEQIHTILNRVKFKVQKNELDDLPDETIRTTRKSIIFRIDEL
ncbi:unnamed protein product [Rotaria sordida]|uniref:EF-hand domain-containing protein n=1 Tax=Rotaria sordida TaxID=392033 RepID=A0A815AYK9_9BILA|nr:unnamed protein product [Rotaria sordida]CAF1545891.1 unnamed protein product [Rotaria sordida]